MYSWLLRRRSCRQIDNLAMSDRIQILNLTGTKDGKSLNKFYSTFNFTHVLNNNFHGTVK